LLCSFFGIVGGVEFDIFKQINKIRVDGSGFLYFWCDDDGRVGFEYAFDWLLILIIFYV
jgi:hypothetical protein